jgi:hypothetical protein
MAVKIQGNTVIYDDGVFKIGAGTTAQRPASPKEGELRYNTDEQTPERFSQANGWQSIVGDTQPLVGDIEFLSSGVNAVDWVKSSNNIYLQNTYPQTFAKTGIVMNAYNWLDSIGVPTLGSVVGFANQLIVGSGPGSIAVALDADATVWSVRSFGTVTTGQTIKNVAYGNNTYVVCGTAGLLKSTTTNLNSWTVRTSGTTTDLQSVAFGNGIFVLVGNVGYIRTSTNGVTWTVRSSNTTARLEQVVFGNGVFITGRGGATAPILSSTNGSTWTVRSSATTGSSASSLNFVNGLFIVGLNTGDIKVSTDGVTWEHRNTQLDTVYNAAIEHLVYLKGIYVASSGKTIYTSTDTITWAARTLATSTNISKLFTWNNTNIVTGTLANNTTVPAGQLSRNFLLNYNFNTEFFVPEVFLPDKYNNEVSGYFKGV